MIDNRKFIVRKAKDGINYEAVIQDYCAGEYDRVKATSGTVANAISELRNDLMYQIIQAERDLAFIDTQLYRKGECLW